MRVKRSRQSLGELGESLPRRALRSPILQRRRRN
jgi:hypothetical protein